MESSVSLSWAGPVDHAVILAAGNGDRFRNGLSQSKLLTVVDGVPLLTRTVESAYAAGIRCAHIVLGYDAASVRALAERSAPSRMALRFHLNADWHRENGLSVLAVRDALNQRAFALMMGDHIFDASALGRLLHADRRDDEVLLGVDKSPCDPAAAAEATKVRLDGDRVTAIDKTLDPHDALDTGLFVCSPAIFGALADSCDAGDSTLSGGVRRLAARNLVRAVTIGDAHWCDIDTVDDLAAAEALLRLAPAV